MAIERRDADGNVVGTVRLPTSPSPPSTDEFRDPEVFEHLDQLAKSGHWLIMLFCKTEDDKVQMFRKTHDFDPRDVVYVRSLVRGQLEVIEEEAAAGN